MHFDSSRDPDPRISQVVTLTMSVANSTAPSHSEVRRNLLSGVDSDSRSLAAVLQTLYLWPFRR